MAPKIRKKAPFTGDTSTLFGGVNNNNNNNNIFTFNAPKEINSSTLFGRPPVDVNNNTNHNNNNKNNNNNNHNNNNNNNILTITSEGEDVNMAEQSEDELAATSSPGNNPTPSSLSLIHI